MPSVKPSTLVIELVFAELCEIGKVEGDSPIVTQNSWFLARHNDVTSLSSLIGRHKSCALDLGKPLDEVLAQ